ncbi:MAG: cytochrome P450 [Actinomadura sp.]
MAFGHGVHTCIGQWLARAETQIALTTLATRIPHTAIGRTQGRDLVHR